MLKLIRIDVFSSIPFRINFDLVPYICLQIYNIGLTIRPQSWHSIILLRFGSLELQHQKQGQTRNPIQCFPSPCWCLKSTASGFKVRQQTWYSVIFSTFTQSNTRSDHIPDTVLSFSVLVSYIYIYEIGHTVRPHTWYVVILLFLVP